MKSADYRERGY